MHPPFAPLVITLLLGGEAFTAVSFSEAGLTLPATAGSALLGLPRRRRTPAVLRMEADGSADHYAVEVRLAGCSAELVEVVLAELPPQARLRLRHASADSNLDEDHSTTDVVEVMTPRAAGPGRLPNGRRLILAESADVWVSSEDRRGRPRRERLVPVQSAANPARIHVLRGFAALALATLVLIVLAGIMVAGG